MSATKPDRSGTRVVLPDRYRVEHIEPANVLLAERMSDRRLRGKL